MRKTTSILAICALVVGLNTAVSAQTKKAPAKKSTATTKTQAKPAAATKTTSQPATEEKATAVTKSEKSAAQQPAAKEEKKSTSSSKFSSDGGQESAYKSALGVKFLWGIALTGKHFFKDQHAIEAIVKYRGYARVGSDINLALLYEYHKNIPGVEGLRWYAGGGIYLGYFSFKDELDYYYEIAADQAGINTNNFYMGIVGALGLEYKIQNTPIAVSADWQPAIGIIKSYGSNGFSGENGGFGVKYTF